MIRDNDGARMTPKQKAQDLLLHATVAAMYALHDIEGLTDRERAAIEEQIVKQRRRIERLFGYEPGAWGW